MNGESGHPMEPVLAGSFEEFEEHFPVLKPVFGLLDIDVSSVETAYQGFGGLPPEIKQIPVARLLRAQFARRGWILYDDTDSDLNRDATQLVDQGRLDDAEQILVGSCQPGNFEQRLGRMKNLRSVRPYWPLAQRALKDHSENRHNACIASVLVLMDRLAQQAFVDAGGSGSISTGDEIQLEAWDVFFEHSDGLRQLRTLLNNSRPVDNRLTPRQIVFYTLDFAGSPDVLDAAKSWNALFSVADWARNLVREGHESELNRSRDP